jgi:4'-phosphopantetheinyl transferase
LKVSSMENRMGGHPCDVWVADLAVRGPAHDALLDDVERARSDAFVRAADRSRFVLGAALVKLAVANGTGGSPASVRVNRRCPTCGSPHGRPRVVGSDLHVSVAHSGSLVVVALTSAGPVGVDVEQRGVGRASLLAPRVVTSSEPIGRPEDLLTYWCRKESVVKATGEGLRVPLTEVVVSPAEMPARLVSYRGRALAASMTDLDVGDAHVAALTVLTGGVIAVGIRLAAPLLGG